MYKGDVVPGDIDVPSTVHIASRFMQGVLIGYTGEMPEKGEKPDKFNRRAWSKVSFDSPDYDKLAELEKNVYHFSGAKNYQEIRAINDLLRDGDRVRSKAEHRKECEKMLGSSFEGQWHDAEYNLSISGSQAASKWASIEKAAKLNPQGLDGVMLEYRTQRDGRVRDSHQALDRVRRLASDKFWDTYAPPNAFNCRCYTMVVQSDEETPLSKIEYPELRPMFRTNIGKTGIVFPKDHPYYKGCPRDLLQQTESLIPGKE